MDGVCLVILWAVGWGTLIFGVQIASRGLNAPQSGQTRLFGHMIAGRRAVWLGVSLIAVGFLLMTSVVVLPIWYWFQFSRPSFVFLSLVD